MVCFFVVSLESLNFDFDFLTHSMWRSGKQELNTIHIRMIVSFITPSEYKNVV
jgi:hypothetical protein